MEPLLILVGPTASGKSRVSIPLARRIGAEIVSLDSMLLYRGMSIGTDKPSDQGGVPHHLIDILDPSERFDLRRYLAVADEAISSIRARGRRVLVVGGTGLYLMGLLQGVFEGVPRNPALRDRLAGEEVATLHARLAAVDPATAARIHKNDRRRITRALEAFEATGRSLRDLQAQFAGPPRYDARIAGLERPHALGKERIEERVRRMFETGLVREVEGLALGPTASQAVGYKEVRGFLDGQYDLAEARRRVVSHTVRLSRRQRTWFKRFPVRWFDAERPDLEEALLAFYLGRTTE